MARYQNVFRSRKSRPLRAIKKKYLIVSEGCVTEPEYFAKIDKLTTDQIEVRCISSPGRSLSPCGILKRIEDLIREQTLFPSDEIWAVLDRDEWTIEQLGKLGGWGRKRRGRSIGMSNPKFEYWLLLHFEKPKKGLSANDCDAALQKYLPNYDKHVRTEICMDQVRQAIARAKAQDVPRCEFFPEQNGSTVYRLLERIFAGTVNADQADG